MSDSPAAAGRTAWARNLGAPVRDFLSTETGGAVVLIGAAIAALIWANSPWPNSYEDVWNTTLSVALGDHVFHATLREWVNQGLMTLFFLVVGLEAKRELDVGELRERGRIGLPALASLGGMAGAVAIYLAFNAGGPGADGWGAAISTDTALALGVLALVAGNAPARLRVLLLSLVVVDDLVALLVIAVVYTEHIAWTALGIAAALFALLFPLRFAGRWRLPAAAVIGVAVWVAMFESGIDPVIAGLAVGLVISAYPPSREDLERATELTRQFRETPTPELALSAQRGVAAAISPNERLQYRLHPWTSFVVVPVFALANAGIHLDGALLSDAATSPITIGIALGYVAGKPLGIVTAAYLATRRPRSKLPVTWPGLWMVGASTGVGFTVSFLIAGLAFTGQRLDEAKIGVLAAALVSPAVVYAIRTVIERLPESVRQRQLLSAAPSSIVDLSDDVDPARDHIRGKPGAPVTLLEYGDFECPYCGTAEPTIHELLRRFEDEVRFVFRHLPLNDVHSSAQIAAEGAEAAAAQGAFWEMYDLLLSHQDQLAPRDLIGYAAQLGLDVDRFRDDLRQRHHASRVAEDVASADASGVSGTPTFFINGRRHDGVYDVAALSSEIKGALARSRAAARAESARETQAA
jgi:Na+/H+ antiporter NhaA